MEAILLAIVCLPVITCLVLGTWLLHKRQQELIATVQQLSKEPTADAIADLQKKVAVLQLKR